ncbi:alkanesulfonate monooxygenase SsuD/methylene tetrahydromethanopterin reductase-like flavin-dependent oxidoreductase (luciferase family) [Pseudoclavibacter sp. JAI123]|uniref:LLM class flavin-dependent oxidoreductase n=1 Tax=Pseudoclavibacter sp. JAI123 TaxID=2723065 RepID=UPI0015CD8647|nr:LLM class flavin-dependent oxidoreductase [Pseudoclavibacter sp. JAI123]NYF12857.1 alkanesulfonate monooxygenase SsuD/methylene tetrahydromethanopterin reductase-like flavin-dependent oxidoreductase (luciferase family) [Pseudoclavibacter sp. JAI123]
MTNPNRIHLGVALDGAGIHPAAWREPSARPDELFTPEYWVGLVQLAEQGLLDFVTIEDSLALQSSEFLRRDNRTDEVRGRLDALLIASRVSPVTEHIGLIPTVTTTHTEPFHVSKAVATLDYTSLGRAGWQARVSPGAEHAHFGRRDAPLVGELFAEANDFVEVVRRLWDSWEDDAEIRDASTDRFLDAAKVHRIEFEGKWFSVRGPSITPRPPQGQPVVAALGHAEVPYEFAAASADLLFVTPTDVTSAVRILSEVRAAEKKVERDGDLSVFVDLAVFLDEPEETGSARLNRLNAKGRALGEPPAVFAGSAEELVEHFETLAGLGYDGFRLHPGVVTDDLPRIVADVVPLLQRKGLFRERYEERSLRGLLGLETTVPNRYAAV